MSVFDKGYNAFIVGQVGNPHPLNTNSYREWERGWNKSYFENLAKVKERETNGATGEGS